MITVLIKKFILFIGLILITFRLGSDILYQNFKKILPNSFTSSPEKIINPGLSSGTVDEEIKISLTPTPVVVQLNINNDSVIPDLEEWGKAKQVSEHSWTMKIGFDSRMATPNEIFEALNSYRQKHGRNSLNWDDRLANYATQRAKYFTQIGNLDGHAGFSEFVKSEENIKILGFWWLGENSSYGYRLEGVHLIEWVYAGDQPHDDNQLSPDWTHVGIGVDGYQTDIIFAAHQT